jgi:hypothetical protein
MASFTSSFGYRRKPQTPQQLLKTLPQWDLGPKDVKPGMYDPSLDWQGQTENQGFGFSQDDIHSGLYGQSGTYVDPKTGAREDFSTPGLLQQLTTRKDTALQRGQEDYNTQTADLGRNYQRLGTSQGERARAAGVAEGGSLAQALQKRTANQAHDQAGIDTSWRRFQDDTNTDYNTRRNDALAGAYTGTTRGEAAHTLFGQQLGGAKVQSAQQMGTLPTAPPPGMIPSLATVLRTGSLVGTGLDANSPIYRKPKRRP